MKYFVYFLKGLLIGVAFLSGLSGGTMMIILGVFDEAIHSLNEFLHFKFYKFDLMVILLVGMAIGIFLFSGVIDYLTTNYHQLTFYFLTGLVGGGILELNDNIEWKKVNFNGWVSFAVGLVVVIVMMFYNGTLVDLSGEFTIFHAILLVLLGVPIAAAIILPGISTMVILNIFGLYNRIVSAISNLEWIILIPLVIGVMLGVVLLTGLLENQLSKHPLRSYLIILGFVVGSIFDLLMDAGIPGGINILWSILLLALGYLSVVAMRKLSAKYK